MYIYIYIYIYTYAHTHEMDALRSYNAYVQNVKYIYIYTCDSYIYIYTHSTPEDLAICIHSVSFCHMTAEILPKSGSPGPACYTVLEA